MNKMRFLCGKLEPPGINKGILSAAAIVTTPRIPAHPIKKTAFLSGTGSFSLIDLNKNRGRYVAG